MKASFSRILMPCVAITDDPLSNTRKYLRSEPDCGNTSTRSASLPFHCRYKFFIASIIEPIIVLNFIEIIFQRRQRLPVCLRKQVYNRYDNIQSSYVVLPAPVTHLPMRIFLPVSSGKKFRAQR